MFRSKKKDVEIEEDKDVKKVENGKIEEEKVEETGPKRKP